MVPFFSLVLLKFYSLTFQVSGADSFFDMFFGAKVYNYWNEMDGNPNRLMVGDVILVHVSFLLDIRDT